MTAFHTAGANEGLKTGRSPDAQGIIAEMIREAGNTLVDVLFDLYNQIISDEAPTLASWKQAIVTVIYKSGNTSSPPELQTNHCDTTFTQAFCTTALQQISPSVAQ